MGSFKAFVRFQNVTIPNGANITGAFIRLTAKSSMATRTVNLKVYVADADDQAAPTDATELNAISLTTGTDWDNVKAWVAGSQYDTPDLSKDVKTVVDRVGWASGQAMVFVIDDNDSTVGAYREFYTFDYDSGSSKPELHIHYATEKYASSIHSLAVFESNIYVGEGTNLWKYGTTPAILTGMTGNDITFARVGDWIFFTQGATSFPMTIYNSTVYGWGVAPPTTAPTVSASVAGEVDLTDGVTYQWTLWTGTTGTYYLEAYGGGDPGIGTPQYVKEDGSQLERVDYYDWNPGGPVVPDDLENGQWTFTDPTAFGTATIVLRLSDDTDPDAGGSGKVKYLPFATTDLTDGATYKWLEYSEVDDVYYCVAFSDEGDPELSQPNRVMIDAYFADERADTDPTQLSQKQWFWASEPSGRFNTIYIRCPGDVDPDSGGSGYVTSTVESITWLCYYSHKVTLPDGTIIRTALSPEAEVTVAEDGDTIVWTGFSYTTFLGLTSASIDVELWRTKDGLGGPFLVYTKLSGDTHNDSVPEGTLVDRAAFTADRYYSPPGSPDGVIYHPGTDRVFVVKENSVYWSESGKYRSFLYDEDVEEYESVNDVFIGANITAAFILDENLYFCSKTGIIRLRGKLPSTWLWEPTTARKGPLSWNGVAVTPYGVFFAANDGRLYLFNGYDAKPAFEKFVFDTNPDEDSTLVFDGRYLHLFYSDATYPELIIDFYGYPEIQPRIIPSSRTASASYYDNESDTFYIGDSDGYVRTGADEYHSVGISIKTPEIPVSELTELGDIGSIVVRADTQGDDITVTPYFDGKESSSLTSRQTTELDFIRFPMPQQLYYTVAFRIDITSKEAIRIMDPLMLSKED